MRRVRRSLLVVALLVVGGAIAVPFAADTRAVNQVIDRRAVAHMADVAAHPPGGVRAGGAPRKLPYRTAVELEALTRPPEAPLLVARAPLTRFRLDDRALVQEVVTFPSAIHLAHPASNTATAYVYRHGPLGARPVVVWVPGQYVSDAAMWPISWFLRQIVARDVDVVFLVPPYHLDRTPPGFASGDAVLATDVVDHLNVFAQELSDLRRVLAWVRRQGAPAVGGFGGSLGAMMLLRVATWDDALDFLTVFIPMIRLADLLEVPQAEPMRARLRREDVSLAELTRIYAALDPTREHPRLAPARISVLYARYDLIAPPATMLAWANAWGVTRLHPFDRGHALALFTRGIYAEAGRLLDEDLRALRPAAGVPR